ncbi:inner membrane transporter YjeM [Lactobacillus selangorensis]|uniref:Inner membrane transporter YjeM n=1 Tax=Lactobacillus selangorensis TaxID=81857 RepID=A0A0R2FPE5_9LACO|nr:glutamate/gamma-aminobutyrate family transporter YjeM [Lactobacillus selangorensis]KRN27680.1 inner membrane transporter YjeM [Lactobacillus selangorensis]KRN30353.1 inner membrane transporter YjeM [Lactobacillus selangorensis]
MEEETNAPKTKKIGLIGLVLMVFTSIYGLGNTTVAYDQMGYAAIMWYVIAAALFFFPTIMMFAEYGSSFKAVRGGIYSWLAGSIGERMAFIGTFIWLSSWIVWLVSEASKVWIPFAVSFFGHDTTQTWHIFGLSSTETIALCGIALVIVATYFSVHGFKQIARFAAFGGTITLLVTGAFMLMSLVLIVIQKGQLAQPFTAKSIVSSPNPQFSSPVAILSFVVYAIFAYGGMETMGGVIDNVKKPEKTFPRAMIVSMIMMMVIYSVGILLWGVSANWHSIVGGKTTNLGNVLYVLMNNLGMQFGKVLGLSHAGTITLGNWFARIIGIEEFLSDMGAFFVLLYSPLKSFILGSPKKFWPKKMTQINKYGVPAFAMWVQAAIVSVMIFAVAFGGSNAKAFYTVLTDMENISGTFPYLFLVGAFPFFRMKKGLDRPFQFYHNMTTVWVSTAIAWLTILFGIIFTEIEPIMTGDYYTAFWTIAGPIVFGIIALIFYNMSERRTAAALDID